MGWPIAQSCQSSFNKYWTKYRNTIQYLAKKLTKAWHCCILEHVGARPSHRALFWHVLVAESPAPILYPAEQVYVATALSLVSGLVVTAPFSGLDRLPQSFPTGIEMVC